MEKNIKSDIVDDRGNFNYSKVSIVPHTIKTSYAYKRSHYLDLKTICDELGPPQLFLTFSCHDTALQMKNATGIKETWKDPILFAMHFQRKWLNFLMNMY